jgi:hypothetical protein
MRLRFLCLTTFLLLSTRFSATFAQGGLCHPPTSWTVDYWIHETPTDPNSPVTVKIQLALSSNTTGCSSVGWNISSIEIRRVNAANDTEMVWVDSSPEVFTPDGLWWVTHANVTTPVASEFLLPPHLSGVATASPSGTDLSYDFAGLTLDPVPTAPYSVTAWLDHSFQLQGEATPFEEGTDEPVESDPPRKD